MTRKFIGQGAIMVVTVRTEPKENVDLYHFFTTDLTQPESIEEMTNLAAFRVSSKARYITGVNCSIDRAQPKKGMGQA